MTTSKARVNEIRTSTERVLDVLALVCLEAADDDEYLDSSLGEVGMEDDLVATGITTELEKAFANEGLELPDIALTEGMTVRRLIQMVQNIVGNYRRLQAIINQQMIQNRQRPGRPPACVDNFFRAITPEAKLVHDLGFSPELLDAVLVDIENEFNMDFDLDFRPETIGDILKKLPE